MKAKKSLRFVIVVAIMACLVVGYFFILSKRGEKSPQDSVEVSEMSEILAKDLEHAYPETPRAVVKLYSRIIQCYFNEKCTEDEQRQLGAQARMLLDEELLENNEEDVFYNNLIREIEGYQDNKMTLVNYSIDDSDDVIYKKVDGRECAALKASYFIRVSTVSYQKTNEEYILRKDEDGKWKILGYKLVDKEEVQDE